MQAKPLPYFCGKFAFDIMSNRSTVFMLKLVLFHVVDDSSQGNLFQEIKMEI